MDLHVKAACNQIKVRKLDIEIKKKTLYAECEKYYLHYQSTSKMETQNVKSW